MLYFAVNEAADVLMQDNSHELATSTEHLSAYERINKEMQQSEKRTQATRDAARAMTGKHLGTATGAAGHAGRLPMHFWLACLSAHFSLVGHLYLCVPMCLGSVSLVFVCLAVYLPAS